MNNYSLVMRCTCLLLITLNFAFGQDNGGKKNTYFHNISIDAEGHVCYLESMPGNAVNRIEYRANGKSMLDIFFEDDIARVTVQLSDFDNEGTVDHIYVMREELTGTKGNIRKIDYYRGPQYLEHLKKHYKHALLTATHPLIAHRPDEKERAKKIEKSLDAMNSISIEKLEMGTYTADGMFVELRSPELQETFMASDTLNTAVRNILTGDFRILSKSPEITTKYNIEINTLLSIKPPPGKFEEE
ncbi:MAG: hypothetical protein HYY49_11065 [Ignavibacteriales bacterium]|nr:hypothetical protein [Ignavibacteriales bacterium]